MTQKGIIHIIDDEPIIHEVLGDLLTSEGYELENSASGEEALDKHSSQSFQLVLLDLLLPGIDGIEVLKKLKKIDPNSVIIIITAFASVESAISAMKIGAYDYIQKPFKHDELLITVQRAIEYRKLQEENIRLKDELQRKFSFENIIGKSEVMKTVFETIKASAPTRSTILLLGESGTGKELVARAIHQNSDRKNFRLSFHIKGTIFFDEISSLNMETQSKLLRVMQDREFMKLGGTKTIRVDVRVIAATNADLEEQISEKMFREDLFYRLNVIKIELPLLKERKEDIPLLVKHFLDTYSEENEKEILGVTDDVMEILVSYDWPGNIRELENLIERAVVLTKSKLISRKNLPPFLLASQEETSAVASVNNELDLKENIQTFQKKAIISALKQAKGIQKKAANLLGVKPTTLNEMIKRLNIDISNLL